MRGGLRTPASSTRHPGVILCQGKNGVGPLSLCGLPCPRKTPVLGTGPSWEGLEGENRA